MHVAVVGCGYVGRELGRQLVGRGHPVVGVGRSAATLEAVEEAGLDPVRADATDASTLGRVPDVDAVVYAASAGRDGDARATYVRGLRTLVDHFAARSAPPGRLVYTSSTGVFGDHGGGWVHEGTPPEPATERGRVLLEAERVALDHAPASGLPATVVRFAGLYGPGRYRLDRYLEGPVTAGVLNLVHREDAAGAVRSVLEREPDVDLLLAVDDEPVGKWALADWLAERVGRPPPRKVTLEERLDDGPPDGVTRRLAANKRCSNARLRGLGYDLAYPTFRDGYAPAIEAYLAGG